MTWKDGFYIVGNGGPRGLRVDHEKVTSWMKIVRPESDLAQSLMSDPTRSPLVVALFHDVDLWKQSVEFTLEEPFHRFTMRDAVKLNNHLVDMVVLDKSNPTRCRVIEALNPDWRYHHFKMNFNSYIVDGIRMIASHSLSINRCRNHRTSDDVGTHSLTAYQPNSFKHGQPTALKINDCSSPTWLSEDKQFYPECEPSQQQFEDMIIDEGAQAVDQFRHEITFGSHGGDSCMEVDEETNPSNRGSPPRDNRGRQAEENSGDVDGQDVCDQIRRDHDDNDDDGPEDDAPAECPNEGSGSGDGGSGSGSGSGSGDGAANAQAAPNLQYAISRAVDRLAAAFGQPIQTPWESQKTYKPADIDHMRQHYPGRMPWKSLRLNKERQSWFHYVVDAVDNTIAYYGCWVCQGSGQNLECILHKTQLRLQGSLNLEMSLVS